MVSAGAIWHKHHARKRLYTTHLVPFWLRRFASTEVAQRPSSVTKHGELVVLVEKHEKWLQSTSLEDVISTFGRVTSDVTKSPDAKVSISLIKN